MTRQLVPADLDAARRYVVEMDAQFGLLLLDPDLPRPAFRPPQRFEDLTTAEQSLLRPPAWLAPCRHEHGRQQ